MAIAFSKGFPGGFIYYYLNRPNYEIKPHDIKYKYAVITALSI